MGIVKREDKLMFISSEAGGADQTYNRMKYFTDLSTSKNPVEYSRRYVDEATERTDVTGYATSIAYAFDQYTDDAAQEKIVEITDNELTGEAAIVSILIVDLSGTESSGAYPARMRNFAVIPDSEGDSTDAYTYSGTLKANGDSVIGTAATTDEWLTCTFTEKEAE